MTDDVALALTAKIVAAYVSGARVKVEEVADLIRSIHDAIRKPIGPIVEAPKPMRMSTARVRKSLQPDHLISFEDGKPYRMLRRHLTKLGLTPETYRRKWGLPEDYPMVAPLYAEQRSQLAKQMGLGTKPGPRGAKGAAAARKALQERGIQI